MMMKMLNWKSKSNEQKLNIILFAIVLLTAGFVRFAFLTKQGFISADEYAAYHFLTRDIPTYTLEGTAGSMWERPFAFFLSYVSMQIFGPSPNAMLIRSALCGFFTVIVVYIIGVRYIHRNVGLFSAALMASIFSMVYYSRNMKNIAPSLLFCAFAILLLFSLVKTPKKGKYLLCGLSLGAMITAHPNTLPMAVVVLFLVALSTVIFVLKRKDFTLLAWAWLCPLGVILPMAGCELFFVIIRNFFPFWEIGGSVGYIQRIMQASAGIVDSPIGTPSIQLYLRGIENNGSLFLWIIIAVCFFLMLTLEKFKKYGYIPFCLFWGPIIIYVLSPTLQRPRNVISSLIPACLLCGIGIAQIINLSKALKYARLATFLIPIFVFGTIGYGLIRSGTLIKDISSAQQIWDYIQTGRASLARPNKSVYYWEKYYFNDVSLSCDTWADVFRNYLSRRAEYLVPLPHTAASELLDPKYSTSKMFRHVLSNGKIINYGVYDLKKEQHIFKEKFGFTSVLKANTASRLHLRRYPPSALANDFIDSSNRFELSIPPSANLLIVSGRLHLCEPGELLTVALGTTEEPFKYSLEMFQPPQFSPLEAQPLKTSIHTAWRVAKSTPKKIALSLLLTTNNEKNIKRMLDLDNFEISFYRIPAENIELALECLEIGQNEERTKEYTETLRRYGKSFQPETHFPLDMKLPGRIAIQPSNYKPNTKYRISFKTKTNYKTVGRVGVFVRVPPPVPSGFDHSLNESVWFWKPWWKKYHLEFITLPIPKPMKFYFREAKDSKPEGIVFFKDVKITEVSF